MSDNPKPAEYATLPLELWTLTDLTDALTVERAAKLLKTTRRVIYTIRNTNVSSVERTLTMIDAVRKDEKACRERLTIIRNGQYARARAEEAAAAARRAR